MRPLRAFATIAALLIAWGWWRLPAVHADIARHRAASHIARTVQGAADSGAEPAQVDLVASLDTDPARTMRPASVEHSAVPAPLLALAQVAPDDIVTVPPAQEVFPPSNGSLRQRTVDLAAPTEVAAKIPAATAPDPSIRPALGPNSADAIASEAYRALASKNRGAAVRGLRLAVAAAPHDSRAAVWRRQIAMIEKRWSGSAYVLARESGGGGLAAAPVLGGGQSGAQLGYTLDPLSRRPTSLVTRVTAPNEDNRHAVQAAFGLSWRPVQAASVTIERLVALGREARHAWTLRLAGGVGTTRPEGAQSWNDLSVYVETGIVGANRQDLYAAGQARAGRAVAVSRNMEASAGIGAWASIQRDMRTVGRVEVGSTVRVRADVRPAPIELSVDYRFRIAGNAVPDTGPAATLSTNS